MFLEGLLGDLVLSHYTEDKLPEFLILRHPSSVSNDGHQDVIYGVSVDVLGSHLNQCLFNRLELRLKGLLTLWRCPIEFLRQVNVIDIVLLDHQIIWIDAIFNDLRLFWLDYEVTDH